MKISSNLIKILAIIILLFLNISLLLLIRNKREECQNYFQVNQIAIDSIKQLQKQNGVLLMNAVVTMKLQGERIDEDIVLLDEINNFINLKKIVDKSPKLIFMYSELSCEPCVDEQLRLLKNVSEKLGTKNIMIITTYDSPRKLAQFVRLNQIDIKVLNLQKSVLSSVSSGLPYYFILDDDFLMKQIFVPIKGEESLSEQYFNKVFKKYFEKNE